MLLAAPALAQDAPKRLDSDLSDHWECFRAVGWATGLFPTGGTWETVGQGRYGIAISPVLNLGCAVGGPRVAMFWGGEFLPMYLHRTWDNDLRAQMITVSIGATTGTPTLRFGAMATVGNLIAGFGGRFLWLPWRNRRDDARRGFEVRLLAWPEDPIAVQGVVSYTVTSRRLPRLKKRGGATADEGPR